MTKDEMVQKIVEAGEFGHWYLSEIRGERILRVVAEEHGFVDAYWPKTLEERVTVQSHPSAPGWIVRLDGLNAAKNIYSFEDIADAERYRNGLIQELREKETQKQ